MNLIDLISSEHIHLQCDIKSQKSLFAFVADQVRHYHPDISASTVIDALLAREKLGSTGFGGGIAIPHCRLEHQELEFSCIVSLETPLSFDAIDDKPVDLFVFLIISGEARQTHLDMLASVSNLLSDAHNCDILRACNKPKRAFEIVTHALS